MAVTQDCEPRGIERKSAQRGLGRRNGLPADCALAADGGELRCAGATCKQRERCRGEEAAAYLRREQFESLSKGGLAKAATMLIALLCKLSARAGDTASGHRAQGEDCQVIGRTGHE